MASNVVVVDSSFRRTVVKTTPSTHLSDVLQEACTKFGLDASQYGLKNNNKQVDLSRTIRLSGLSSGAKLELILSSRSPSVVSVALQLPESEAEGILNGRLTDKFPSNTTLWQILRRFESGAVGEVRIKKNFTGRGVPHTSSGDTGAGRLCHQTPVLHIMGRELSSFIDLQKTLGQLGFNNGSTLLRLSFRTSDTPFEEAQEEIDNYFKSLEGEERAGTHANSVAASDSKPDSSQPAISEQDENSKTPPEPLESPETVEVADDEERKTSPTSSSSSPPPSTVTGPNQRPISVFAPPTTTVPHAARQNHNEADYEPTIDHAKLYQSRLSTMSRNKRLLTDAEIAAQQETQAQKLAGEKEVEIKVRFPDQTQVVSTFTNLDTAETLYDHVRSLLDREAEPFLLKFSAPGGQKDVPKNSKDRLIGKLGMMGRVLVTFVWEEDASGEARSSRVLKARFAEQAKEIEIKEVEGVNVKDEDGTASDPGKGKEKEKKKGGPKAWMPRLGKK